MRVKCLFILLTVLLNVLPLGFAQAERPIVRLIYFLPSDRAPQPDIDAKMDRLIKDTQAFFATQMAAHGFGRKTFQFETDAHGNAVVHHIKGKFTDEHYNNSSWEIWNEIGGRFDLSKNFYLTAIDLSSGYLTDVASCGAPGACGYGADRGDSAGLALMPASGHCFGVWVAAHELGHAFGLRHDSRLDAKRILSHDWMLNSFCAAEWLDAHRAFNATRVAPSTERMTVEMLPPSLVAPPNAIRFRFKVTDPDRIHQVQLITPERAGDTSLLGFKGLNSSVSSTVEFVTSDLRPRNNTVWLQAIDVHGNFSGSKAYPIDVTSVLPPPKIVSIPDPTLAAAVREQIGNAVTTHTMLNLEGLGLNGSAITDLTGLEHAHNLTGLILSYTGISDIAPLKDLTKLQTLWLGQTGISDIAPLKDLKHLRSLRLYETDISDIASLKNLTKLTELHLLRTGISDIAPLKGMTQLQDLFLAITDISDIAPLAGLTQLRRLTLDHTSISDIAALADLTELVLLGLVNTSISDISVLADLKQLVFLYLSSTAVSDVSALTSLTQLKELYIRGAPLSYASIHTHIPAMQARGIKVEFDNVAHPALLKISGDGQEGSIGKAVTAPFVVEVQDERGQPKPNVTITFSIEDGEGTLNPTQTKTDAEGKARTFLTTGWTPGITTVRTTATGIKSYVRFMATATPLSHRTAADVNADGDVDVEDLVYVASSFGALPAPGTLPDTDVNDDGEVNEADLRLVLAALEGAPGAPALDVEWAAANLPRWIAEAKQCNISEAVLRKGIAVLEQWLADLLPKETELLTNYPNPFNPETWIPYQLSEPTAVTLHIRSVKGDLVRTLAVGHRAAGVYHSKSRAAYWDGRNEQGERVASGIYFYTLTAGDFTATRKMLIQK